MEVEINNMLALLIGWEEVDKWWNTPHDALGGMPKDLDLVEVYDYVDLIFKTAQTWD